MKTKEIVVAAIVSLLLALIFNFMHSDAENGDTWIPKEYQSYCEEIGEQYGACPELLEAIIETESSGKANVSNGSCKGLMQISEKYHRDRMRKLGVANIYDPYGNILVGTDYLMELAAENEDLYLVLMKYNGVSNAKQKWERGEYSDYAKKIVARTQELERIHGK